MKVKMNKKVFIAIVAIIIIIAVVAILVGVVMPMIKSNQIKGKLGKINAEELQAKLIQEFEKTPLNINTYETKTTISDDIKVGSNYGFVKVFVMTSEINLADVITIPLFKIESDSNGNFKSIEYVSSYGDFNLDIERIIFNLLENEYGIKDINYNTRRDMTIYNKNSVSIDSSSDRILLWYVKQVRPNRYNDIDINSESDIYISSIVKNQIEQEVKTTIFGLDI